MTDIPDAAVEAAARALYERMVAYECGIWESRPEYQRDRYRADARAILTAGLAAMWRPIEEKPRMAGPGLVELEDGYIIPSRYGVDGWWVGTYGKPRRWMPLPAPPPASEEG